MGMVINIISAMMSEERVKDERTERLQSKGDRLEVKVYRAFFLLNFMLPMLLEDKLPSSWNNMAKFSFMVFCGITILRDLLDCHYGILGLADKKEGSGVDHVVADCLLAGMGAGGIGAFSGWSAWVCILAGAAAAAVVYALFVAAYNLYLRAAPQNDEEEQA